jgi:hypothetical protein
MTLLAFLLTTNVMAMLAGGALIVAATLTVGWLVYQACGLLWRVGLRRLRAKRVRRSGGL